MKYRILYATFTVHDLPRLPASSLYPLSTHLLSFHSVHLLPHVYRSTCSAPNPPGYRYFLDGDIPITDIAATSKTPTIFLYHLWRDSATVDDVQKDLNNHDLAYYLQSFDCIFVFKDCGTLAPCSHDVRADGSASAERAPSPWNSACLLFPTKARIRVMQKILRRRNDARRAVVSISWSLLYALLSSSSKSQPHFIHYSL